MPQASHESTELRVHPVLKGRIERNFEKFHSPEFLFSDPLGLVLQFKDPWDQEAVGVVGAQMAYGGVKQIRASLGGWLRRLEERALSPSAWIRRFSGDPQDPILCGTQHRFQKEPEWALLFKLLQKSQADHGSLGSHFSSFLAPEDLTIEGALNGLLGEWRIWASQMDEKVSGGLPFRHLISRPADGSACKRWCMFLRWMGRGKNQMASEIDPGTWLAPSEAAYDKTFQGRTRLKPSQLIFPLDVHTRRICRELGLLKRGSADWKAALEATASLRQIDREDPIRFDFSLCRIGILKTEFSKPETKKKPRKR